MGLDYSNMYAALKEYYAQKITDMVYKDNPFYALVAKGTEFPGKYMPIPIIYGDGPARSATFATAQAQSLLVSPKVDAFHLTRVKNYAVAVVDNETMEASKGNEGAFISAAKLSVDRAINSLKRDMGVDMYGSGYGEKGQINATVTGTTLTLASKYFITNFEVGMKLCFASTVGSSALRKTAGGDVATVTVTKVDRMAGSMTVDTNLNTVVALAQNDYIFIYGDREDSATPTMKKISGFDAWVPMSAPTSTAFHGVDRSIDSRLGGLRLDASTLPIEEALIEGVDLANREGAHVDYAFMNFYDFSNLKKALGSKVLYVDKQVTPKVSFRGVEVDGGKGTVTVLPDTNCPVGYAKLTQLDTWKLHSIGEAVRFIDTDGLQSLRQSSADGVEFRLGFYGNLGNNAPGFNLNLKIS